MSQFAVIGLGSFGYQVVIALFNEGNDVIAIDLDKNLVQSINPFCSHSIVLDAADKEVLGTLGLEGMDGVVISVGSNISSSILICLHLSEMGVKRIIAKAVDEDHAKILAKVGATEIVHPERDMALKLAKSLSHPNVLDFIPVADNFEIIQINPPREFWGKSLRDLGLRAKYGIQVIAVKEIQPEKNTLIPPSEYVIKEADTLVIIGETKNLKKIRGLNRK